LLKIFLNSNIFVFASLSTALSPHCSQRPGGLAQRRLPLNFMRATKVQFPTKLPAGLLPPLRQTASWLSVHFVRFVKSLFILSFLLQTYY
jgi:hypothetical protein